MNPNPRTSFVVLISLTLIPAALVRAQNYNVVIYEPPAGFVETDGEGIAGQQRVGAARVEGGTYPEFTHAFLWTGNSTTPVDLHPAGATYSKANATDGTKQVGYVEGYNFPYINRKAALWSGTPESVVLLMPPDQNYFSEATSIAGDQQVGYVDYSFHGNGSGYTYIIHSALWHGTPESYVDLHPNFPEANWPGDQRSKTFDTDGTSQVGYTNFYVPDPAGGYRNETRAILWYGTPESAVILHPADWDASYAYGVKNGTQVGYGLQTAGMTPSMALVWHGSAQSLIILGEGSALDTNGTTHVGNVASGYSSHAFRWDGDSGDGFDLHNLLPPGFTNSGASDIDGAGNIIGWAQRPSGYLVGVLWSVATPYASPSISLVSPVAKRTYGTNTNVYLSASATDSDGSIAQVEFFVDGVSVGVVTQPDTRGRFGMNWRATGNGTHRVQARATDNQGATTMSHGVMIMVSSATGKL